MKEFADVDELCVVFARVNRSCYCGAMNKRSETELVQEAQNGNLRAFEELVERYRDLIFRQYARGFG